MSDKIDLLLQEVGFKHHVDPKINGAIWGRVVPAEASPAMYALVGSDIFGASYADDEGNFIIDGLPEGKYELIFMPEMTYEDKTLKNIDVTNGHTTHLGIVELSMSVYEQYSFYKAS